MLVIAIINKRLLLNVLCYQVFYELTIKQINLIYINQKSLLIAECLVIDKYVCEEPIDNNEIKR